MYCVENWSKDAQQIKHYLHLSRHQGSLDNLEQVMQNLTTK